jgi:hypothetical protein
MIQPAFGLLSLSLFVARVDANHPDYAVPFNDAASFTHSLY